MKSTTYYCKPEKSPSKIFQLVVDPIQNSGLELSHFFPLEKKKLIHDTYIQIYCKFYVRPTICRKYFLSFPQKNFSPEKLTQ